jgi:hypothetical protein
MKRAYFFAAVLSLALPMVAAAQGAQPAAADETTDSVKAEPVTFSTQPALVIQHIRPNDKRGLFIFEAPKEPGVEYTGFKLAFGGAFTQQFQALEHNNTAVAKTATGSTVNINQLMDIGSGFNNAVANLYLNAQLAPGIRVAMTTYLSSRHHNEAWVKDGYVLIDQSPINTPLLNNIMKYTTLRLGHFEINYGDAHFRRTDNGNAMYNPFVGNLIMDAFTTEIGGEAYVRTGPFIAMLGVTNGEVKGSIQTPDSRGWAKLAKLGVDKQVNQDLRVRLMGSLYTTNKSASNTLYTGDRAGSRYYLVLENTAASTTAQAWSANVRPGFNNEVTAFMVNPFIKFNGLEIFGTFEQAEGKASAEAASRTWNQYAIDGVYRLLDEKLFVGARYNTAAGKLTGIANEVSVDRWQASAGWFITPSIMMKGEYVTQKYNDFPTTDIRNGGKFDGFMVEGVVSF